MNLTKQEADILIALSKKQYFSQRELAADTGHALGMINKAFRSLSDRGYLIESSDQLGDREIVLSDKAKELLDYCRPQNAIILAAGFGMRMVPINLETPKALLTVNGEKLIERIIRQLHSVGINDIYIVVGFMKERFEYLIDKYNVNLIVNRDYAKYNNLRSLAMVSDHISNTYIIPSDVWCDKNPFSRRELYSWYMVSDEIDDDSDVRVNRKNELVLAGRNAGNAMVGISYLCGKQSKKVVNRVKELSKEEKYKGSFWEEALYDNDRMMVTAKVVHSSDVVEINTYEQLRDLDDESEELKSDAIDTIKKVFSVQNSDIKEISVLKKGMTNRSFLFNVCGAGDMDGKYIMRIPGEGTDKLINRADEAEVYRTIKGLGLCDDPVYINPENGYKITKFLDGVRVCDAGNDDDLMRCMKKLHKFHSMKLKVNHTFDLFERIEFYHGLWKNDTSMYDDHVQTTENVFKLRKFIEKQSVDYSLTHIDAVPDNFLFYKMPGESEERLQLTDWEYAGMQDPHVDIAMFCIYAMYNRKQVDHLIDLYFAAASENDNDSICTEDTRTKIYCYIAICGLLWSNWCEYKSQLGVEFGEYSLRQYRYAKDYYRFATERM